MANKIPGFESHHILLSGVNRCNQLSIIKTFANTHDFFSKKKRTPKDQRVVFLHQISPGCGFFSVGIASSKKFPSIQFKAFSHFFAETVLINSFQFNGEQKRIHNIFFLVWLITLFTLWPTPGLVE